MVETAIVVAACAAGALLARRAVADRTPLALIGLAGIGAIALPSVQSSVVAGILNRPESATERWPSLLLQALGVALLLVASTWHFGRRAHDPVDPLMAGVAIAVAVLGVSLLVAAIAPTLDGDDVGAPEPARLLALSIIVAGGLVDIARAHRARLAAVAREERLRVLRDLHDSVTQDVTTIASLSAKLAADRDSWETTMISRAARHALIYLRGELRLLQGDDHLDLRALLHDATAGVLGDPLSLELEAPKDLPLDPGGIEALIGIVREAAANAGRHGNADRVRVTVRARRDGVLLEIADNGCGFVPSAVTAQGGGVGLRSMRERAAAVGGHVTVHSAPGEGTTVCGWLPAMMPAAIPTEATVS